MNTETRKPTAAQAARDAAAEARAAAEEARAAAVAVTEALDELRAGRPVLGGTPRITPGLPEAGATEAVPDPVPGPELDLTRLRRFAAEIAAMGGADLSRLEDHYRASEGLVMDEMPEGAGIWICKMLDVISSSSESRRQALINWSNAARRAVLQAEAE